MNQKWSEKTTFQKIVDIVSGISLIVWLLFSYLERTTTITYAALTEYIALFILCVCETISFWNVKRVISYIAIAGLVCMAVTAVLEISLL